MLRAGPFPANAALTVAAGPVGWLDRLASFLEELCVNPRCCCSFLLRHLIRQGEVAPRRWPADGACGSIICSCCLLSCVKGPQPPGGDRAERHEMRDIKTCTTSTPAETAYQ